MGRSTVRLIIIELIYLWWSASGPPATTRKVPRPPFCPPKVGIRLRLLELVGGFLILIGLFTRPVAFVLAGDMAVAYFMMHAPKSFFPTLNGGQLAMLFCFVCSFIWPSRAEASGAPTSYWRAHAHGDDLDRAAIIILRSSCV